MAAQNFTVQTEKVCKQQSDMSLLAKEKQNKQLSWQFQCLAMFHDFNKTPKRHIGRLLDHQFFSQWTTDVAHEGIFASKKKCFFTWEYAFLHLSHCRALLVCSDMFWYHRREIVTMESHSSQLQLNRAKPATTLLSSLELYHWILKLCCFCPSKLLPYHFSIAPWTKFRSNSVRQKACSKSLFPRDWSKNPLAFQTRQTQRSIYYIPVVPQQAVAEVSRRGKLQKIGCCESRMSKQKH